MMFGIKFFRYSASITYLCHTYLITTFKILYWLIYQNFLTSWYCYQHQPQKSVRPWFSAMETFESLLFWYSSRCQLWLCPALISEHVDAHAWIYCPATLGRLLWRLHYTQRGEGLVPDLAETIVASTKCSFLCSVDLPIYRHGVSIIWFGFVQFLFRDATSF